MMTGFCFFISLFFAPIFASIPPWATGCTLIIVGSLMAKGVLDINWNYIPDAIPAFITLAGIPFFYSIADGIIAGILTYIILNVTVWIIEKLSGGRIVPPEKDQKEYWSYRIPGGVLPPWLKRAVRGKKDFWKEDEEAVPTAERAQSSKDSASEEGQTEKNVVETDKKA